MAFFEGMGVYERVPRSEQTQTGEKIIGTKWIDANKGDFDNPRIRCRLVGKDFKTGRDDAFYASTPPRSSHGVAEQGCHSRRGRRDEGNDDQ